MGKKTRFELRFEVPDRWVWLVRAVVASALALALLLPAAVIFGVQQVEERYGLAPSIDPSAAQLATMADRFDRPGRFGLRVTPSAERDAIVVSYRAIGVSWLLRLIEGPPVSVSDSPMFSFRSSIDLMLSLPALGLVALAAWHLAGRWTRIVTDSAAASAV